MNIAFTLLYDTIPIGNRNEIHEIPMELADLLDELYLFFKIRQKENSNNNYESDPDNYIFVPIDNFDNISFKVMEKNNKDYLYDARVKRGINEILNILNMNSN